MFIPYRKIWSNLTRHWPLTLCLVVGLLIGMGVPWVMAQLFRAAASQTILIAIANTILLATPWLFALKKGSFDLFEPVFPFSLIYFYSFVVAPLTLIDGQDPFLRFINAESVITPKALTKVMGISFLGLIAFYAGYYSLFGKALARSLPVLPSRWRWKRIVGVVWGCSMIGYALFGLFLWRIGGVGVLVRGLYNRVILFAGKNYLAAGATLVAAVALLWFSAVVGRRRISFILMAYIMGALLLTLLLGSKTNLLVLVLIFLILYHYLSHAVQIKHLILFSLLIVVGAVAYDLYFREYIVLGRLTSISFSGRSLWDILQQLWDRFAYNTFIQAQTLLVIVEVSPGLVPYQKGRTFLALLLSWVPRSIYPAKPISPAGLLTKAFRPEMFALGYTFPPSIMGEFYLNFGVVGVVVGMALFGLWWRILYDYMRLHRRNRAVVLVYAISLGMLLPWFRGESLGPTVLYLLLLGPLLIAFGWISGKAKPASFLSER